MESSFELWNHLDFPEEVDNVVGKNSAQKLKIFQGRVSTKEAIFMFC